MQINNFFKKRKIFCCTVGLISLISIIYLGFIASDVYVTESKFIVRSAEKNNTSTFGTILDQMGVGDSRSDSWVVHDYMLSKDVMTHLNTLLDIKKNYSDQHIDLFNRFPGIRFWDKSIEAFHAYYQNHVEVSVDPVSSITTLTVRSFQPQTSLLISKQLLELSEELINKLNQRVHDDLIKTAQNEVQEATQKIYAISSEMTQFREKKHITDPEGQGLVLQRLSLEKELANKQLVMSLSALQKAKSEALKQQLYIVRIANPSTPDIAREPNRIGGIISMFFFSCLLWGIASLLVSSIKEHQA